MGEGISCGLASSGFNVYKLVPTGSVDEVNTWKKQNGMFYLNNVYLQVLDNGHAFFKYRPTLVQLCFPEKGKCILINQFYHNE